MRKPLESEVNIMPELIRDTMGFNDGIKRCPMIPNDAVCKVTRGELFQKIDDGYGHTFLKPIASNTVVLGGAILALEKLCGTQASFKPTTLNDILSIPVSGTTPGKETICLFGCGTGGELIGFIIAVTKQLPNIKKITISALDGNSYALKCLECILEKTAQVLCLDIESKLIPVIIDDFYDMQVVEQIITQSYDFVISFKAICEFVTKQQFEQQNPYEHIINVFMPKLSSKGVICLADVTSFNAVSHDWLPIMLDNASKVCNVDILYRNGGFNEDYYISHTHHKNDISKIAWRIYKNNKMKHK